MKVALHFILTYLAFTESWIYSQLENLRKYRPIVYAIRSQNLEFWPIKEIRVLIHGIGLKSSTILHSYPFFFPYLMFHPYFIYNFKRDKPNVIHAHHGPSGFVFLKLKKVFKFPLITSFYGYDMSMLPKQNIEWISRYKKLFKQGNRFLVEGTQMKKSLMQLGCDQEKITIQHLGVDLNKIKFIPRELKEDQIRVLMVGHFREKKGIPYGIRAFAKVKKKHNNMQLTIIGNSSGKIREEKEKKRIIRAIENNKLSNCVKMMGYQPYPVFLKEAYKHHIFLSPSIHASSGDKEGGAPVSILDMSASGMPILSTSHCDIPEIVLNGKSGYLVPEKDVDALAKKLEFLVENPSIWKKMGEKGREHIKKNYNIVTQIKKLEEIYDITSKEA
jgi:colanic acid/amylovoran biosynthesis glycosyltransferase